MKFAKLTLLLFFLLPAYSEAKMYAPFETSGWIPYWKIASGTAQALTYLDRFKEVNPFGYIAQKDGTLKDEAELSRLDWKVLQAFAKWKEVRYIPSVMWSDAEAMHKILSSETLRKAHIKNIVDVVKTNGFDGIDLDYERKYSKTVPYYHLFVRDLSKALGSKWLVCTEEPYTEDDLAVMDQYCDRVRVMAYDQVSVDLHFKSATEKPYVPIADVAWVEKIITRAMEKVSKNKLVIGIPTYGYKFKIKQISNGFVYDLQTAFNQDFAVNLAKEMGITPVRNVAGELSFSYTKNSNLFSGLDWEILWWSDAQAVMDKYNLAKRLGVRGVAIFKIDGGADPALWELLPKQLP